jgi:hypothetical protein
MENCPKCGQSEDKCECKQEEHGCHCAGCGHPCGSSEEE